jgi:hypothetical protein
MNDWMKQYPNTVVTRLVKGDPNYASQFRGDADVLLYQLKNLMQFNNLGQLDMQRIFTDGTVIKAKSIFGHDIVEIDVSQSIALVGGTCTITLINFPIAVPPMQNPGVVEIEEVVEVDYFKTYYFFDVSRCPTCQDIVWNFLFTYSDPVEPRHYVDPVTNIDEPDNHTIYSLSPPAWGEQIIGEGLPEILRSGRDEFGNYIIWKAYTETGDISRTGLGIMLIKAVISDNKGIVICNQQQKIDVDCCLKVADLRKVEIWWEDFGTCQPFITYPGVVYNAICLMPTEVPIYGTGGLNYYGNTYPYQPLYSIPEINGSCLPMEWTLSGPITFRGGSKKNDNTIFFQLSGLDCYSEVGITLKDRCGTEYIVRGTPCCEDATALSIGYYTLLMSCGGQQQTFTPNGGCSPYTWAVTSGGGTITQDGVYTTPDTNPNCTDNPTITLTDCCGNSASIGLAVNCYGSARALGIVQFDECSGCWCDPSGCNNGAYGCFDFINSIYDCTGALLSVCETRPCANCTPPPGYIHHTCVDCSPTGCPPSSCYTGQCGCIKTTNCPCGVLVDGRSDAMKAAGCCPLNPFTGLPYYFS